MSNTNEQLFDKAKQVRERAYAPYSKFNVGACIESSSGKHYIGCNIENAAYGLTLCAEASAIAAMVSAGETSIRQITVITDVEEPSSPCGACRQRIYEFAESDATQIHMHNLNGKSRTITIGELLPGAFGPKDLK